MGGRNRSSRDSDSRACPSPWYPALLNIHHSAEDTRSLLVNQIYQGNSGTSPEIPLAPQTHRHPQAHSFPVGGFRLSFHLPIGGTVFHHPEDRELLSFAMFP